MCMVSFFGWTTAAFAVLTAALIGFQIFNIIDLDKRVKRAVKKNVDDAMKDVNEKIDRLRSSMHLNLFNTYCDMQLYDTAIMHILSLISNASSFDDKKQYLQMAIAVLKSRKINLNKVSKEIFVTMFSLVESQGLDIAELKAIVNNATIA